MDKTQICSKCKKEYPSTIDFFDPRKDSKTGFRYTCKKCDSERRKIYYINNIQKITEDNKNYKKCHPDMVVEIDKKYRRNNSAKVKLRSKRYRTTHLQEIKQKDEIYRQNHKEDRKKSGRRYRQRNRAKINEKQKAYSALRRINDIGFKIKGNLRSRLRYALKDCNGTKSSRTMEMVGCTLKELIPFLEQQFSSGMSWDNYGFYGWHIDHKIPCAAFDLTKPEDQKVCFNYKNLQPLWARDNTKKSSFYNGKLIRQRRTLCPQL